MTEGELHLLQRIDERVQNSLLLQEKMELHLERIDSRLNEDEKGIGLLQATATEGMKRMDVLDNRHSDLNDKHEALNKNFWVLVATLTGSGLLITGIWKFVN